MEGLEFYSHGPRKRFDDTGVELLGSVQMLDGSARLLKNTSSTKLSLNTETQGETHVVEFELQGEKYMEFFHFDIDDVFFFATDREYVLLSATDVIVKRQWLVGLSAMKIGPGFKLALYQEDYTILSCSLDVANGQLVNLFSCTFGATPENIPVAWGSRSKNYKRGIKTRESTYIADGDPSISWTADGEHFVVNALQGEDRHILVFTKTCRLLHKSEPGMFPGLEKVVAFRPDGLLIGCVLSEDGKKQELILIQKNLEILYSHHLEANEVRKIEWSPCCDVLGVYQTGGIKSWLDLYLISSTKFYLKHRLPFNEEEPLYSFRFKDSLECSYVIELSFNDCSFQYSFVRKIMRSDISSEGPNITCEIDGKEVDIYLYSRGILPPRSCDTHTKLRAEDYILTVIFDSFKSRFAIVDIAYNVCIYNSSDTTEISLMGHFTLQKEDVILPISYYRFFFKPSGKFCAVRMGTSKSDLDNDTIFTYSDHDYVLMKTEQCRKGIVKGQVIMQGPDSGKYRDEYRLLVHDSSPVSDHILFKFRNEFAIKRYSHGDFCINESKLPVLFTSIHFTETHILITKSKPECDIINDYLIAVELNEMNLAKLAAGILLVLDTSYSRPIEKGAIILNDIPGTSMIVLLLPRGNTECIHLRNISIKMLNEALSKGEFHAAYDLIKFESLGFNLLVDLNPSVFRKHFDEIILTLHESALLFKFIIELTNKTTLTTEDNKVFYSIAMKNKRFEVCNLIVDFVLDLENPIDYLTEVAIAALCCQPEGYNSLKSADVITSLIGDNFDRHKEQVISTIRSLNPYIPYEAQYDAALEIYNLELAELIAERSEMDPQVYRPYLAHLKMIPDAHARQIIALKYQKIREAALYCIERFEDGEITLDELQQFAVDNDCFDTVYLSLSNRSNIPIQVVESYALQLQRQQQFRDAGVVLNSNGMCREAVGAFLRGIHWQDALSAVYNIPGLAKAEMDLELRRIAETLVAENRFKEAAHVYENYCEEPDNALRYYVKAKEFRAAYMLMMKTQRGGIKEILVPTIKESMAEAFSELEENQNSYRARVKRLKIIREKKNLLEEEQDGEHALDTFSESGSTIASSSRSGSSRSSAKKRSKEEKKIIDTKEGSKYEDIALMRLLYKMAEQALEIIHTIEDQSSILDIITSSQDTIFTNVMLRKVFDYKRELHDSADEIWPEILKRFDVKAPEESKFINISELDLKYRTKPDALLKLNVKII